MAFVDKIKKGIKWTASSYLISVGVQSVQFFILSKVLSPSEFGVVSIIAILVGFAPIFIDLGFSNAIIHKQNISKRQLSTLYWLNVLLGFLFFVILNISADSIANFYNINSLKTYISLVSLIFLIIPFGQQYLALLQKNMQFKTIAKIDITSYLFSLIVFLVFILLNLKIYSFIYSIITLFTIKTFLLIVNGYKINRPSLYFNAVDIKYFLKFGLYQLGERFINYFNTHIDIMILAKVLDTHSLGLYSLVKEIILRPIQFINPIVTKTFFPLMAKYQHNNRILAKLYVSIINSISIIMFTLYWSLFFFSSEILSIFGKQWIEASFILKIMSLYAMLRSISNPVGTLLMAKGKVNIGFCWNLTLALIIPIFVFIGSFYNITGVAFSFLLLGIILYIPNWYFQVYKICNLSLKKYLYTCLKNFAFSFTIVIALRIIF